MASKADTLKIAQADLDEIKICLSEATASLQGRGLYARKPGIFIDRAIPRLERIVRRLKQSFSVKEGPDA